MNPPFRLSGPLVPPSQRQSFPCLSEVLSWVANIQLDRWTKQVVSTRLLT